MRRPSTAHFPCVTMSRKRGNSLLDPRQIAFLRCSVRTITFGAWLTVFGIQLASADQSCYFNSPRQTICGRIQATETCQRWWAPGKGGKPGGQAALLATDKTASIDTFTLIQLSPNTFQLETTDNHLLMANKDGINGVDQPVRTDAQNADDGTDGFRIELAGSAVMGNDGRLHIQVKLHPRNNGYLLTISPAHPTDTGNLPIGWCLASDPICVASAATRFTWQPDPDEHDEYAAAKSGAQVGPMTTHNHPNCLTGLSLGCPNAQYAKSGRHRAYREPRQDNDR